MWRARRSAQVRRGARYVERGGLQQNGPRRRRAHGVWALRGLASALFATGRCTHRARRTYSALESATHTRAAYKETKHRWTQGRPPEAPSAQHSGPRSQVMPVCLSVILRCASAVEAAALGYISRRYARLRRGAHTSAVPLYATEHGTGAGPRACNASAENGAFGAEALCACLPRWNTAHADSSPTPTPSAGRRVDYDAIHTGSPTHPPGSRLRRGLTPRRSRSRPCRPPRRLESRPRPRLSTKLFLRPCRQFPLGSFKSVRELRKERGV